MFQLKSPWLTPVSSRLYNIKKKKTFIGLIIKSLFVNQNSECKIKTIILDVM